MLKPPKRLNKWWRRLFKFVELAGAVGLAVAGLLALSTWVILAIASLTLLAALVHWLFSERGDREQPYIEVILKNYADRLWDRSSLLGTDHHHRVTLFRLRSLGPWGKFRRKNATHVLVPCARIPAAGQRPVRSWFVHDHRDEECEGVAGRVFAFKTAVTDPLPDLNALDVSDADFEKYARLANDEIGAVKKARYYARRIGGTTIFLKGERWGVLIFDSPDPGALGPECFDSEEARHLATTLSEILGRVEQ